MSHPKGVNDIRLFSTSEIRDKHQPYESYGSEKELI